VVFSYSRPLGRRYIKLIISSILSFILSRGFLKFKIFGFCLIVFQFERSHAAFWKQKATGWHWYEDKKSHQGKTTRKFENKASPQSATDKIKQIRALLEEKLAVAILNPTPKNILAFQKFQKFWVNRSEVFSKQWILSLLKNPDIDETIRNPVSSAGIMAARAEDLTNKEELLKENAKKYTVFVFYKENSEVSKVFLESVKNFEERYGWNILYVSANTPENTNEKNNTKPNLMVENSIPDNGIIEKWGIKIFPAAFIVDPVNEWYQPIGFGALSSNEIRDNITMRIRQKEISENDT